MFNHIVVPLDESRESTVAVPQACTLARASRAEITLLRVVSRADDIAEATAALNDIAREFGESNQHFSIAVRQGNPAEQILEEVQARHADVVVMRTRGRSGLGRALLGSVAERIVTHCPTPVVLLPPEGRSMSTVGTLLVPVDGSPGGVLALSTAVGLANTTGARVRLLQVVLPVSPYLFSAGALHGPVYIDPAWDEDAEGAAHTYVDSLVKRASAKGVLAEGEVVVASSVNDEIIRSADAHAADLIVMSSEALTGAARAFLGSVTDAVVRNARCPVLVIRRSSTGEGGPSQ